MGCATETDMRNESRLLWHLWGPLVVVFVSVLLLWAWAYVHFELKDSVSVPLLLFLTVTSCAMFHLAFALAEIPHEVARLLREQQQAAIPMEPEYTALPAYNER